MGTMSPVSLSLHPEHNEKEANSIKDMSWFNAGFSLTDLIHMWVCLRLEVEGRDTDTL